MKDLTYEEKEKLRFKIIARNFDLMPREEQCKVIGQILHRPVSWIPKKLLYDVLYWIVTELEYDRIEVCKITEQKINQFKIVK